MSWARRLLLVIVLAAVTGCASASATPPPRQSTAPRTRCLSNPNETDLRPMFFLFCVESP